ncbi:unnamed protein product [Polarella glacialis]|uniref:Major facilitator superfamily (MFS) profile domain-containing protein n=1 Tax=Polarella glacialis TaxID=89957 RepID=A0A813JI92_POLGL|nr:unnamed protein product [Polarella glacialis]
MSPPEVPAATSHASAFGGLGSVYLAVLFDCMGAMMVMPLLPFLAREMHGSPFAIGCMQSFYSLMQIIGTLVLGTLADRVGKRKVLLVSLFCSSFFLMAFGLATTLWQLVLFRGFNGFFAGTVSICQAIVADATDAEHRVGKMALIMAAYGVGVVLGPGLAGLLAPWGVLAVCMTASCCTFLNFLLAYFQLPSGAKAGPKEQETCEQQEEPGLPEDESVEDLGAWDTLQRLLALLLSDPVLSCVLWLNFLQELTMGAFMGVTALLFADVYGITGGGLGEIFCVAGVSMVVFQGLVVKTLVDQVGRPTSIMAGSVIRACTYAAMAALELPLLPWLAPVGIVAAGALIDPCTACIASERAPSGLSGIVLGVFQSTGSLGSFLGPVLAGALYCVWRPAPYWAASAASAACIPVVMPLVLHHRRLRREELKAAEGLQGASGDSEVPLLGPLDQLFNQAHQTTGARREHPGNFAGGECL